MPASSKKRRKLTIDGRLFLWSLHEEDVNSLHVVSADKRLNLRYGWQHALPSHERYVDVMGPDFEGLPIERPMFSARDGATPGLAASP